MKANPDKYHFLPTGGNEQTIYINEVAINISKEEKLLGIIIDNKLNFHTHTKKMCNKVSQKLNAFTRISNFINPQSPSEIIGTTAKNGIILLSTSNIKLSLETIWSG